MEREGGRWVRREGGGERGVASKSGCVAERTRGGRERDRGWWMSNIMSTVTRFFTKTEQLYRNATNHMYIQYLSQDFTIMYMYIVA